MLEALESMRELFTRFGGHRQAAGVTMEAGRVEEFRRRLNEYAGERLGVEDFRPRIELDAEAGLDELDEGAVGELLEMAPFGFGNPRPLVEVKGAEVAGEPAVVKEKHLRVALRQRGRTVTAMAWGMAERAGEMRRGAKVDAALHVEADAYGKARGWEGWRVTVKDVRAG